MTALFSLELHAAGPLMHVAICNVDGVRDSIVARAKVETTLVYSAAGNQGALAADSLQKLGYLNVFSLKGGLSGWLEAGGLVETRSAR